jgi:hypothetical protein
VLRKSAKTASPKRFAREVLAQFEAIKYLYIRSGDHRFIPIWVVVVQRRVIVRSWNDKPGGWYRAFLKEPRGHVKIEEREVTVRAVPMRNVRLNDATDEAFAAKYTTRANLKYVEGFRTPSRKATTLELVPA